MMLALVLSLSLHAGPSARVLYEEKCLYCHSEEVTEEKRLTVGQWRSEVTKMRLKAPLLITRHDAELLTMYIVNTLKLVPPESMRAPVPKPTGPVAVATPAPAVNPASAPVVVPAPAPAPVVATPAPVPEPVVEVPPPPAAPEPVAMPSTPEPAADPIADKIDEEGEALVQARCSKCHTLNRVFNRLDSYERSKFVLHRMRLKTGSGISRSDESRIEAFLKGAFSQGQ